MFILLKMSCFQIYLCAIIINYCEPEHLNMSFLKWRVYSCFQARLFDEPQLASLCLENIDKNTGDALAAEGFTDIDLGNAALQHCISPQ